MELKSRIPSRLKEGLVSDDKSNLATELQSDFRLTCQRRELGTTWRLELLEGGPESRVVRVLYALVCSSPNDIRVNTTSLTRTQVMCYCEPYSRALRYTLTPTPTNAIYRTRTTRASTSNPT